MNLWNDLRSGERGRMVGNRVLAHLERRLGRIEKVQGTVFESPKTIIVARMCSSDGYLSGATVHWANTSGGQQNWLAKRARDTMKAGMYLFVTATPSNSSAECWLVPAEVVEEELRRKGKADFRGSCAIHIRRVNEKDFLGDAEITDRYFQVPLDATSREPRPPVRGKKQRNSAESKGQEFTIPLSGMKVARLAIPVPIERHDVQRISGWLELMSDLLTGHPSGEHRQ